MVILGLGTNLGNRLENLNRAVDLLKEIFTDIKTSLIYENKALLPNDAPSGWDIPYYNMVICGQTHLTPHELLKAVKNIEQKVGRALHIKWAPRLIDIDILFYDNLIMNTEELTIPHAESLNRSFVMVPLYQLLPTFIHPALGISIAQIVGNFHEYVGSFSKTIAFHPKCMGILNVTPDSFSDGGQYSSVGNAVQQALKLINDGAYVLDLGAQSTHPRAKKITWQEELARLSPVMKALQTELSNRKMQVKISIDSFYPEVLRALLKDYKIDIINDVSGHAMDVMLDMAKHHNLQYVMMHSHDIPTRQDNLMSFQEVPISQLLKWAQEKIAYIEGIGFDMNKIILDPGIGFDKSPSQSLAIMRGLPQLKSLGIPILLGHSRKSFMNLFSNMRYEERDLETAVLSALMASHVEYLRVHNVQKSQKALVTASLFREVI